MNVKFAQMKLANAVLALSLLHGASPVRADAVADGYERMLSHQPSTHTPPVPANASVEPLTTAMVEPLREWQAGAKTSPQRYARGKAAGNQQ